MIPTRRHALKALSLALGGFGLPASAQVPGPFRAGRIFTSSNAPESNELLVYATTPEGLLVLQARLPTLGLGTGGGLENQGAVTLSRDRRYLFVTNAASHSVTTFELLSRRIVRRSTVDSGGIEPISVTEHSGIVYVLNVGGEGNVAGFRNAGGSLRRLSGGTQPLSAAGSTGAAQVGLSPRADLLLVTERFTNVLSSYRVRRDGRIDPPRVTPSSGTTPFGFAFTPSGEVVVSEAFRGAPGASAASSYRFEATDPARPLLVSASVGTTQSAACWVALTPDGRHAYTTNTASSTVSRYEVSAAGALTLRQGVAAASGAGPIDVGVSALWSELYVLNSRSQTITSFTIGADGSLSALDTVDGLPVGANGLAVL